jgi:uncharacterized Zn finger protein
MASAPGLTEAQIRAFALPETFARGREYFESGTVTHLTRRGAELQAEVEGSQYTPYQVHVTLAERGLAKAVCTCPYAESWEGACKHIVATLLACVHQPEQVEEHPPLDTVLAPLDRDQLHALVQGLVAWQPGLADLIEAHARSLQSRPAEDASSPAAAPRRDQPPVDTASLRRQVRSVLRSLDRLRPSEAYWRIGGVVDEVRQFAEQARPFLEAGDGRSTLAVLEAVTEEYMAKWTELDDSDGEPSGLFEELGPLWTEAILSADLTPAERQAWVDRLGQWQVAAADYGVETAVDAALVAAQQGWDEPGVQRVLEGEISSTGVWAGEAPWFADDLAVARLNVLERQGRFQAALHLAEAEGQTDRYAALLVKLDRVSDAVAYGLEQLLQTTDALVLARALLERGATREALQIAEHGLTLEGERLTLARWLREAAMTAGEPERAVHAGLAAVRDYPSLEDYQTVQALAGARWPALRDELMTDLRRAAARFPSAVGEILLHEGRIEDAITVAEGAPYDYRLVECVADAALPSHPDWVIHTCRQQAERIMDAAQSKYYHYAVAWLERAHAASIAAGRQDEWQQYLAGLLARHGRKYTLVPQLKRLLA